MFPQSLDECKLNLEEKYLCLDFINTLDWRLSDHPEEDLGNYLLLLDWIYKIGLADAVEVQGLREKAELYPEEAEWARQRAVALREAAFAVIHAVIEGRPAKEAELNRLNEFVSAALERATVVQKGNGFGIGWLDDHQKLDWFLGPIARSVMEVLTTADLQRIKICASEQGCGWVFYDASRNKSRRWCDMDSCGNRAKASSYYHRHAASQG